MTKKKAIVKTVRFEDSIKKIRFAGEGFDFEFDNSQENIKQGISTLVWLK